LREEAAWRRGACGRKAREERRNLKI
jgi:hypothetical protein